MANTYAIGIDLGTTYSCVAVFRNGSVEVIANEQGNRITPSSVAFSGNDYFVGDPARSQEILNPSNTIFDAKRLIGRSFDDPIVQSDMKKWPFEVVNENGKPKIQVSYKGEKKAYGPEEISSMILSNMKETAESYLGCTVLDAVITVPAYFNNAQRSATKLAGSLAELNVLRIINEPTAAAIAYGLDKQDEEDKNVLIFDLGGGTFDVSIVNIDCGVFEVKATAGNTHLGGEDFDNRMVEYFLEVIKRKHGNDLTKDRRALRRLRTACERAKRVLSSATEASVELSALYDAQDFNSSITRARFEALNDDLFRSTLECVEKTLRDADMSKDSIHEVILVGGSTRIPRIQELLKEYFSGKNLNKSVDPDEAVAYGAAVQAAILRGDICEEIKDLLLVDVTPLSLGIAVGLKDKMSILIERDSHIPTKVTKEYFTMFPGQTGAQIKIYEGERVLCKDNNLLGQFLLTGFAPNMLSCTGINVTYELSADGILFVSAVEPKSKVSKSITISSSTLFTPEQVKKLMDDAQEFRKKDEKEHGMALAKRALRDYCCSTRDTIENSTKSYKIDKKTRDEVLKKLYDTMDWVTDIKPRTENECKQRRQELEAICKPVLAKLK